MDRPELFYTGVALITLACLAAQLLRVSLQLDNMERRIGNLSSDHNWFKGVIYRRNSQVSRLMLRADDRLTVAERNIGELAGRLSPPIGSRDDPELLIGDVHPFTPDAFISVSDL